jgi:hypothetical protein
VLAESTYDAAHLFVVEAKQERAAALPTLTLDTICIKGYVRCPRSIWRLTVDSIGVLAFHAN